MDLQTLQTKLTPLAVTPAVVVALTLWGEARGEGHDGLVAVGCVIRNRVEHPRWWGDDFTAVCLDPWQFSCWNTDDPNLPKMLHVAGVPDADYAAALDVAEGVIGGVTPDPTQDADSYFDVRMAEPPSWAARAAHTVDIGHHTFYRVELPAENGQPDAPNISAQTADDLNAAELGQLQGQT